MRIDQVGSMIKLKSLKKLISVVLQDKKSLISI